jgi:hypothetical protein
LLHCSLAKITHRFMQRAIPFGCKEELLLIEERFLRMFDSCKK